MNTSLKKIQDAMLILHQEITSITKNQERIDKILGDMSGTLKDLKKGNVPDEEETPTPKKKKRHHRRMKTPPEEKKPSAAAQSGNGSTKQPKPKSHLTEDEQEKIRELDKDGMTGVKIAKVIGRSQTSVSRFLRMERNHPESRPVV